MTFSEEQVRHVPALGPEQILTVPPSVIPDDVRKRYKLDSVDRVPVDPDDPDEKTPGMGFEMDTGKPVPMMGPFPWGARAVICFRNPKGPDGQTQRKDAWRWDVPDALQDRGMMWSTPPASGGDGRYKAVLLSPARWDGPIPGPTLLLFDAHKGLLWRREVPFRAAQAGASPYTSLLKRDPTDDDPAREGPRGGGSKALVAASPDGSRVLVLIARSSQKRTWAFVYDRQGALKKAAVIDGLVCLSLQRSPHGTRLASRFSHDPKLFRRVEAVDKPGMPSQMDISYFLLDMEGNLLCRFVNEEGKPQNVASFSMDDRYGVTQRSTRGPQGEGADVGKLDVFALP